MSRERIIAVRRFHMANFSSGVLEACFTAVVVITIITMAIVFMVVRLTLIPVKIQKLKEEMKAEQNQDCLQERFENNPKVKRKKISREIKTD